MAEPSYEELRDQLQYTKLRLQFREMQLEQLGVDDLEPKPAGEEEVIIKTCGHIKESGRLCGSAAVTGRDYCYFHLGSRGRRLKMARARARGQRWLVELPPLEDLYAVQVGLQHVLDALASGQLDRRLGYAMLYGLQQATNNLCRPQEVWDESCRFDDVEQTTWADFEAAHGLPEGFDVDTPPEEAFPPPVASPAAMELMTGEDAVSGDDIEMEELERLQTQDPEACRRRAGQLTRKYQHRLQRERDKLARARRILEAARRNHEARKKAPATVTAEAVPANGDAEGVVSDPAATGFGGRAKKSPQGEADKKDQRTREAS